MSADWLEQLRTHPDLLPPEERARRGGNRLLPLLQEYAGAERISSAELASRQRMRLRTLARHCAQHSPHFAARLKAAGLTPEELAEPGGLQALPPLTRRQLVDAGEALFCRNVPAAHGSTAPVSTSGSTGEPITVRRTGLCQQHWLAASLRQHLWHRRRSNGRLAVQRARTTDIFEQETWGAPFNLLFKTGPASVQPPNRSVREIADWLVAWSPQQMLVLPSALREIIAELERTGRGLPGLEAVRTFSETVSPDLRAAVRRVFGRELTDGYSSNEAGIMAIQCPEAFTYHVAEHILIEVVDDDGRPCAPGQTGRVLVTDLLNFATPLIRYVIGDYAEVGKPCACGRPLASIRRFLGRERNLVLLPDGSRHWPLFGFRRWTDVFPVRQFQFIQTDRHSVTAKMAADGRPTEQQQAQLAAIILEELRHPFDLRFEWQTEPLPRGSGGKFEDFVCRAT
jgi:phenylacetate-CoA ligase